MNITFLVLLITVITLTYLVKNLFKTNLKGTKGYVWSLQILTFLILLEALLMLLGVYKINPHFYLLTFPLRFLVIPLLLLIGLRRQRYNNIPALLSKRYFFILLLIIFIFLIPIYALDSHEKITQLNNKELVPHVLLWSLNAFNFVLVFRYRKELGVLHKTGSITKMFVVSVFAFLVFQLTSAIWPTMMYRFDIIVVLILGIPLVLVHRSRALSSRKKNDSELVARLTAKIGAERLYQNPNLTLKSVSDYFETTPNEISGAINAHKNMGFNEYINGFRVQEVIALLEDSSNKKFTLEAIAKMAGFNSTTTFNKAFKKTTGKTPKAYRKLTKS